MKVLQIFVFIFSFFDVYSQQNTQVRIIDSLVNEINSSEYFVQVDSTAIPSFDKPISKVFLVKYFSDSSTLKRVQCVNEFYLAGKTDKVITTSMFYYQLNKLIKQEGSKVEGYKLIVYEPYYYQENTLLYTANKAEDSKAQADYYLQYGNQFLKEFLKKQ